MAVRMATPTSSQASATLLLAPASKFVLPLLGCPCRTAGSGGAIATLLLAPATTLGSPAEAQAGPVPPVVVQQGLSERAVRLEMRLLLLYIQHAPLAHLKPGAPGVDHAVQMLPALLDATSNSARCVVLSLLPAATTRCSRAAKQGSCA